MNAKLIDRLKLARNELVSPRARLHEYTTEDLVSLIDETIRELQKEQIEMVISSRYGDKRKITDNGHGIYTIEGVAKFWRVGSEPGSSGISYFDPEGGPFIGVGDVWKELGNGKIVSIIRESADEGHFKVRVEVETS